MTDRRLPDLSYGHPGKASYDTHTNQWNFSAAALERGQWLLQLLPFKQCFGPSIHKTLEDKEKTSTPFQSQLKWLSKTRPETFPGSIVISSFAKALSVRRERSSYEGPLLAIGRAVDPDRVSAPHIPRILAMSCGGAGHVLRLIKPRTESRGWGKQSGATLSVLDPNSPEVGYWLGDGGTIHQIVSADDEHGPGTWFAVRQATVITIFRPVYGRLHNPAVHPNGDPKLFLPSRLNPNPVAVLRTERANSLGYMDFSFNPWYARQFAVVDPTGFWSIWDIEKPHGKGSSEILLPGRSGQVYAVPDPTLSVSIDDHADGWYRVLWACNVSTIVVCNRRFLTVFDVKGIPTKLKSTEALIGSGTDWILDIKRSAVNMNSLFVLTTSRVFWVEVIPLGEEKDDQNVSAGARVILSYRHFRDPSDETLKLTPIKDNNVSVILTSAQTLEASFYSFWTSTDAYVTPMSSQAPLHLLPALDDEGGSHSLSLHTLCFLNSPLASRSSHHASGPELQYLEQDVKFFQLWALTSNLGLGSTLFSIYNPPPDGHIEPIPLILPPSVRLGGSNRRMGSEYVDDPFILPDGMDKEAFLDKPYHKKPEIERDLARKSNAHDDLRLRLNWRKIFQHLFLQDFPTGQDIDHDINSMPKFPTMLELLGRASDRINQGLGENVLAVSTICEISGFTGISGDLEQASSALREFLESLPLNEDLESASNLVLAVISTHLQRSLGQESRSPGLLKVYDHLVENWITSLPLKVTGPARHSKFKIIRQIAVELSLGSLTVSIQNKASDVKALPGERSDPDPELRLQLLDKDDGTTRGSSPTFYSSQVEEVPERRPDFRLPTPTRTPSIYSYTTSASEVKEDPATSRLRQYALSIKSKPDLGKVSFLSHWPSVPGVDPATYSYDTIQKAAAAEESGGESELQGRREAARRRRRTEKFLQQSAQVAERSSQPMVLRSSPEPGVSHPPLMVGDLPMTQPDRGAFGSRFVQKSKKQKKRTAGFR